MPIVSYPSRNCPNTPPTHSTTSYPKVPRSNFNSTPGMVPHMEPPKKGASSYLSCYAAIRDTIGLPHIDLNGSTSQIHSLNGRTERYFPTRHKFVSRLESERYQPPRKRSLASVATPEKVQVRFPWAKIYGSPLFLTCVLDRT